MKSKLPQAIKIMVFLSLCLTACGHGVIAGTTIKGTDDNKDIYNVLTTVLQALEDQDSATILKFVSSRYFENMGTPSPDDDYGYHELKETILPESMKATKEFYLTFEIHDIVAAEGQAYADIRYRSRARIETPSGKSMWDSHKEFNRIEFVKTDNRWEITAGL